MCYLQDMARSLFEMLLPITPGERRRRDRQSVSEDIEPYLDLPAGDTGPFVESVLRTSSAMMRSRPDLLGLSSESDYLQDRKRWRLLLKLRRCQS